MRLQVDKISYIYFKSLLLLHMYKASKVSGMLLSFGFLNIPGKFLFIPWKKLSSESTLLRRMLKEPGLIVFPSNQPIFGCLPVFRTST